MNVFVYLDLLENIVQRVGFNFFFVLIIQICFLYVGICYVVNFSFFYLFIKIGVFFKLFFFFCFVDVNECKVDINFCFNGGICFDLYGIYECLCVKGWGGFQCNNGKFIINLFFYDLYCYQICLQCSGIEF